MDTFNDYRDLEINNRIAGWWFTTNRTWQKAMIETIGKSMALTLRIMLCRDVGTETFSLKNVVVGALWLRCCTMMAVKDASPGSGFFEHFFEPLVFQSLEAAVLNIAGLFFIGRCVIYVFRTELHPPNFGEEPNVLGHGESTILKPLIDDNSILRNEAVVQSIVAPLLVLAIAIALCFLDCLEAISFYLMPTSLAMLIDESLYHRAVTRKFRLMRGKQRLAEKLAEKLERRKR